MKKQNLKTDVSFIVGKRGSGKTTLAEHIIKGLDKYIIIDRMGEYSGHVVDNEIQAVQYVREHPEDFKIVIRLKEDRPKLFAVLYCITNYVLIVEEISLFCSPWNLDRGLFSILSYGRHNGISVIGISQRPAQMHPMVRTQANIVYSFKMNEPMDIKYLSCYGFTGLDQLQQFIYSDQNKIPVENVHYYRKEV
jgi:energy-coupling factor transporter ATP-binding protein EcfA2